MDRLRIDVGRQPNGYVFRLHPKTRRRVEAECAAARQTLPGQVFASYDTTTDLQLLHGPPWMQFAVVLTGLSEQKIEEEGGVVFVDPTSGEELYDTNGQHA